MPKRQWGDAVTPDNGPCYLLAWYDLCTFEQTNTWTLRSTFFLASLISPRLSPLLNTHRRSPKVLWPLTGRLLPAIAVNDYLPNDLGCRAGLCLTTLLLSVDHSVLKP